MTALIDSRLTKRRSLGNFRHLQVIKKLIDFSSNDYLGLAKSHPLALSISQESSKCEQSLNGFGSTGSRLLTGNSLYVQNLEEELASFHGFEAGILFNCGYMANVGLISSLASKGDIVFFDTHVHASTYDGIRLSQARSIPFKHNDLTHLESRLKSFCGKQKRFICIETIYSTDGLKAPLSHFCRLSQLYNAPLIVDEAHSVGAWGPQGRGLVADDKLQDQVFAQVVTFGKALGTYGAIILGSRTLKDLLINFARPFIYSTALPFHVLAAIRCSYQLFPTLENDRHHIKQLIKHYQKLAQTSSESQIQCIKIKGNHAVTRVANQLALNGFDVRPLMSPTVRQGHEILRICLHAYNTKDEISTLLESIEEQKGGIKNI